MQEEKLEPYLGTEALKRGYFLLYYGQSGAKSYTECSYLPFKPIHELQGYFSSPSCLSSWAVLLVLTAHWMWGGEGTWPMSSERVPGMAKGPVSDVSICSGGLCHMPTFAKPLKDLEFMVKGDV